MVNRLDFILRMLNSYFTNPRVNLNNNQAPSVLYLLRRDAAQCFGYDPNTFEITPDFTPDPMEDGRQILWPGAMTVFAGIDLLSKLNAGTDEDQIPPGTMQGDHWRYSVTGRFVAFVNSYFNLNQNESELIYQLRNALDHSFALWARRRRDGQVYRFTLARQLDVNITQLTNSLNEANGDLECIVYLYELHRRFERAVLQFRDVLRKRVENSVEEQDNFADLVERYGFVGDAQTGRFA